VEEINGINLLLPQIQIDRSEFWDTAGKIVDERISYSPAPSERAGDYFIDMIVLLLLVRVDEHVSEYFTLFDPDITVSIILGYSDVPDIR
jgi:hypothetical protein